MSASFILSGIKNPSIADGMGQIKKNSRSRCQVCPLLTDHGSFTICIYFPTGSMQGTFSLYSRYSEPNTFSRYTSSFLTNNRKIRYMNIGVASMIQLFNNMTIPGTIKTTHAAY